MRLIIVSGEESMTDRAPLWKNWKLLLALVVLLAIFLLPQLKGLFWGAAAPRAETPPPAPPAVAIQAEPGSRAADGFDACAVLTSGVVAAAGLTFASEFVKTTPEPGHPSGKNSCGGPLKAAGAARSPIVLLTVTDEKVSGSRTSHGITYDRQPGATPDDIVVKFGAATLTVTRFSALADRETALAKLIDGIAGNLAAGPKPMIEYRYPAPYNLVPKPCDALPINLFTALTAHPTDGSESVTLSRQEEFGITERNIRMACSRASTAPETVTVSQRIFQDADSAASTAKFVCESTTAQASVAGWTALPAPIGDFSCASPGTDDRHQILFHAGRAMVLVEYRADHPPAGDLLETARKIYALLPH
jgi:hypothetical protein